MIGVGLRSEFLGNARGGGSFAGVAVANDAEKWLEYRLWRAQNAGQAYSMQAAADGSNEMRFEVKQGDVASGGRRSELTGKPWFAPKSATWNVRGQFLIEANPRLSSWCLINQIHQDDAYGTSPIFAVELNTDDTISVISRNNSGTPTTHVTSATPIVRGSRYLMEYSVSVKGTTGDNVLSITIKKPDGTNFLTFSASNLNIGYDASTFNYIKLGIYTDVQPESIAIRWRNFSVAFNNVPAVSAFPDTAARTLPTPFYDGLSVAPTWCWSSAFQSKAAWTDLAYEHEVSLGKIDYIYDQSNNGWGLTQGTDAVRPTDGIATYLFAPRFDSAGDLMTVSVDNDTGDLLDTSGFYIVAVVQPVGVPANDGATGGGSVNNNPLIFGENSGARNFGVVTRDNGKPLGPWDAQFFVKDSGGEKSTGVADCLSPDMPNLIECWHNGTQITMRVNGGAWSTPVTCGAMVATTGFPRIGHCGTSYTGDILSIATWKTPPSSADSALMLSRFYQLQLWWLAGSTLDLDFVNNRGRSNTVPYGSAASFLTTTRASTGYADSAAGVWSSFASNVPRITDKGLLVEEARTNSIRNNSMQGAGAGTPGTAPTNWAIAATGLTIELVGTGTENGVDYVDYRLSGTTGATSGTISFETATGVAAATAQVWTESAFLSFVGGSKSNISQVFFTVTENTAAGAFVANNDGTDFLSSLNSTLTRYSAVRTLAGGGTVGAAQPRLRITWANGVAIDITLRIGWPQLELGAFATSPIRTTSAAATRAADAVTVNNFSSWFTAGPGTMFADYSVTADSSASIFPGAFTLDDGTANNRINLHSRTIDDTRRAEIVTAGVSQGSMSDFAAFTYGVAYKTALALAPNDAAFSVAGSAVATDASVTLPTVTTARLGVLVAGGSAPLNGYIRRIAYFPTRLTNAQLQALTA